MQSYKDLVHKVLNYGQLRHNRTGVDAISLFGASLRHNMENGMPILTTKKINIKACIYELLWFLKGDTNIKYLNDNGVHIWDAWADENGDLGPVYGKQWRDSGKRHIDQVQNAINLIQNDPLSRRIIIDAWSPSDIFDMALPPCHVLYQFYADPETMNLSLCVYMRSADLFLGVPFDIAEGAMLLQLVATVTGYWCKELIYYFGDTHIYVNHLPQIREQMTRKCYDLPELWLPNKNNIFDFVYEDFHIDNYKCHSALKGEVAV